MMTTREKRAYDKIKKAREKEAGEIIYMELCERMPFRPWVKVQEYDCPCTLVKLYRNCTGSGMCQIGDLRPGRKFYYAHEVKLYLRPYDTITEEEFAVLDRYYNLMRTFPHVMVEYQRFVRSRHLDYLNLIEKCYAVAAPPDMYKLPKIEII